MNNLLKLSAFVVFTLILFGCSQLSIASQVEQPDAAGIAGVWQTVVTPRNCQTGNPLGPTFPGILLFERGGTMTGTSTAVSTVYGIWKREPGPRQYSFAGISLRYDPTGILVGTRRITQNVMVDESGTSFVSSGGFQDFDLSGAQVIAGCATSTGTRFE